MSTQAETIMSGLKGLWTKTARFIEAMEDASGPMAASASKSSNVTWSVSKGSCTRITSARKFSRWTQAQIAFDPRTSSPDQPTDFQFRKTRMKHAVRRRTDPAEERARILEVAEEHFGRAG